MDIALDKVCALIRQARRYDVKEGDTDPDPGSNPIDDGYVSALEADPEDHIEDELRAFLTGVNADEQASLVALVWLGRGDYEPQEWRNALRAARERTGPPTADYLMGIPNLPDLLDEGLAALGLTCADEEGGAGV